MMGCGGLLDRVAILVHLARRMTCDSFKRLLTTATTVAGLLLLTACDSSFFQRDPGYMAGVGQPIHRPTSNGPHHPSPAVPDDISYWDGDGIEGEPLIRINRKQQKAFFYKGKTLVGVSMISSGNEDHATPPGRYKITEKDKDHTSSLYGIYRDKVTGAMVNDDVDTRRDPLPEGAVFRPAPMPNFMRIVGGVGMHTGYLPGYAASHGCIRMPHHMAEKFFENVEVGTPVIIE